MCGICGYIGFDKDCSKYVKYGLDMLQNRGYDSMGISYINGGSFQIHKRASSSETKAIEYIKNIETGPIPSGIVVGHSRWRTCGANTDNNAHPHVSYDGKFALVHNGIIENYKEIKRELLLADIDFSSETDSEVIVNLIAHNYRNQPENEKNVDKAIRKALYDIEGTWGLIVLALDEPSKVWCARHGSPILIGFGDDSAIFIASEQIGFGKYVNNYIELEDKDIVVLEKGGILKKDKYLLRDIVVKDFDITPDPFPHWTIKEIHEQKDSVLRALNGGGRLETDRTVRLGGLNSHSEDLLGITDLILLGCGTSYNAGKYALSVFRKIGGFNTVQLFDGASFDLDCLPKTGNTGLLLLSQSGETKDLHRALRIGRERGLIMIGVVNVPESLIAREVLCGVYVSAGREVGVASTKSFTSQVVVLYLIAVWFAQNRSLAVKIRKDIVKELRALPNAVEACLGMNREALETLTEELVEKRHPMFVLGKDTRGEAIAEEASLKLKELTYIFTEAYPSSALKHGPYSCLDSETPVIVFGDNRTVIDEILSRDGKVISVGSSEGSSLKVPELSHFGDLLSIIPIQILSYKIAVKLGNDVDQPKGLAKVVTVD